jgi:hypothetical protein
MAVNGATTLHRDALRRRLRILFGIYTEGVNSDPPQTSAEVKERRELYLYFPCGSSWPVLGQTLILVT